MRWLVVSDDTVAHWDGSYYVRRQWCEFAVELISEAGEGSLLAHVVNSQSPPDPGLSHLRGGDAVVEGSPWSGGFLAEAVRRPFHALRWRQRASDVVSRHDVVVQRAPSPYLPYVAEACRRFRKPLVLMLSGDLVKQAILPHRLPFPLASLARTYVKRENRRQIRIGRNAAVVFVHGGVDLMEEWAGSRCVVPWRTGHLTPGMFYRREDTCQGSELRLIRVCDLSPPRGTESLLTAFAAIHRRHNNTVLDIVGDGHSTYVAGLRRMADGLAIGNHVNWHGWCNRAKVQSLLRAADIQVVCPLADGVARVILEGAASSLPLVATQVGGIPLHVQHEKTGLLVPAGDPDAIVSATGRLILDAQLRRQLIRGGYESAQEWTVEKTVRRMIDIIRGELSQRTPARGSAAKRMPNRVIAS